MKKLKLLFLILFVVGFLLPTETIAQAFKTDAPAYLNLQVVSGDKIKTQDVRVLITPSGNLQLKAMFDLTTGDGDYSDLIPNKGKKKITVYRVGVQVNYNAPKIHFTAYDVDVIVDSNGMAKVVLNWQKEDMDY